MSKLDQDIVISTRVRLARNFSGVRFPSKMQEHEESALSERVLQCLNAANEFTVYKMKDLTSIERRVLVERHLSSADLITKPNAMMLLSSNESVAILIGEEDHLRIQCILQGWKLQEADNLTRAIDTILAAQGYAFDDKLGYLTSCPTNVGTGMRASAMMHLAGLTMTNQIQNIAEMVGKFGYTIRGYYGEGSSGYGSMYQLSNQVTLGVSEEEILNGLTQVVSSIIEKERGVRETLLKQDEGVLQDRLHRSLGLLKYARRLSAQELMERISDVKLGISMNMFEGISNEDIDRLVTNLQPASISARLGKEADSHERDEARAKAVRIALNDCRVY